jgi:hypothetical protein
METHWNNRIPIQHHAAHVRGSVADFMRYLTLIRAFDGNINLWLRVLRMTNRTENDDARFLRWLQGRVLQEPGLMLRIREAVDGSGLWPVIKQTAGL